MKTQRRGLRTTLFVGMLFAGMLMGWPGVPTAESSPQSYEAAYNYLGDYPVTEDSPSFSQPQWDANVQGITHSSEDWFITQETAIWKIPVHRDLRLFNSPDGSDCGAVILKSISDVPELDDRGYDHFGDPDYYDPPNDLPYVLVPVTGGQDGPALAAFRDGGFCLDYVDHTPLPETINAGWVAVDPQGYVYSSHNKNVRNIWKFTVDWERLRFVGGEQLVFTNAERIPIFDGNGSPITLYHMQGGVFSPSGGLLYLVNGFMSGSCPNGDDDFDEDEMESHGGIRVFDTQSWRMVQKSTNGSGHFNYEFHPGLLECEEPEGITYWDLDDGRAPGIRGHLHVLLLDNEPSNDADSASLKHYTHTIYVDGSHNDKGRGTPSNPFNTVGEANNLAWDGAQIKIRGRTQGFDGSYPETLTFSKRIRVLAEPGPVTIGRR